MDNSEIRKFRQFYNANTDDIYTRWPHSTIALTATGLAIGKESYMTMSSIYTPKRTTAVIVDALENRGIKVQLIEPEKNDAGKLKASRIDKLPNYHPIRLCFEASLGDAYQRIDSNGEINDKVYILGGILQQSKKGDVKLQFFDSDMLLKTFKSKNYDLNDINDLKHIKGITQSSNHLFNHMISCKCLQQENIYIKEFFNKNDMKHHPLRIKDQINEYKLSDAQSMLRYAVALYQNKDVKPEVAEERKESKVMRTGPAMR